MATFEELRRKYGFTDQPTESTGGKTGGTGESFNDLRKRYGFTDEKETSPAAQQQGTNPGFEALRRKYGMQQLQQDRQDNATKLVDSYVADIQDFSKNVGAAWEGMDYYNYQDTIQDYNQRREEMFQRTDELIGYLNENADLYEAESLDGMLQWLEQNKTYLQNVGAGLDQQKGFYESFTSEKDYTLYDTYKDTSAEELRELAKTQEDWETRDWMESRAAALEYKAPRALDVIDADLADLNQQIKELEKDPVFSADVYKTEDVPFERYLAATIKLESLKEQRTALQTERQAAVNQADMASLPDTVAEIDAEMEKLDREIAELESKPKTNFEKYGAITHGITSPLEHKKERRTKLEEKRQALIAEEYLKSTYDAVWKAPDFKEKSQYVPQKEKEQRWIDIMLDNYSDNASPWEDPLYEYINGNEEAGAWLSNAGANYYGPEGGALGAVFGRVTEDKSESQKMKEHEVATFNYLYATQGKAAAYAYYSALKTDLYYRDRKDRQRYWAEYAANDPAGASIFSVVTSPMKGLAFATQTADYLADGELTKDAPYNRYLYMSKAIREEVPKNWGPVGSFAYQTGMSMLDFVTTTAVAGGNPTLAMTIMGSGAAADTTLEALDRGLSSSQAYSLGVIAGIAEALTERFSLDALLDKTALTKSALGYWLKNALAEGSEEVASSLINNFADLMISKDKSQWEQSVQSYMDAGYDYSEAVAKAFADQAASLGLDALGGFASGGTLAGLNIAGNAVFKNNTQSQGTSPAVQQPVEQGTVQTPAGVTDAPQVAVQNSVTAEQNPVIPEQNPAVAEQTAVKTEQQVRETPLRQEIAEVVNSREAMQRKLQAAEEAYKTGVISKKELQKIRREAEALNITTTIPETDRVDIDRARAAFEAGEIDEDTYYQIEDAYREQQEQLGTTSNVDETLYNNTMETEDVTNGTGENLHLRNGAQWSYGQNTDGQVSGVEEAPGGVQERYQAGRPEGNGNYSQATQGRVNAEGLGIPGGTGEANLQRVDAEYSADTQEAAKIAAENGLEAVFFTGDNLSVEYGGKVENAKACIVGNKVYIRADHPGVTATQLMKHELAHHKIDSGLIDTDHVYDMLAEFYGEAKLREIIAAYAAAYDMGDTSVEAAARAVFVEIVCDSQAGINYFSMESGTDAEGFMRNVRSAATVDMYSRETRGPPAEGKKDHEVKLAREAAVLENREQTETAQAELTQKYQEAVNQILNMQNTKQDHLIIGYTPRIFTELGMPSLPFVIGSGHVYSMAKTETEAKQDNNFHNGIHYHGMGYQAVADIYDALQDPVMIIASKDVDKKATPMRSTHSVVAIIDAGNQKESLLLPVAITAERTVNGTRMDVNALSSGYAKKVANLVAEAIALENVGEVGVYYAKKEALILPGAGVQFPIRLQQSIASNGIVHRFSEKVNMNIADATQSQQFKRWFGDWQNDPENASKVVNADGTPRVMYHGSPAQFTIFDKKKAKYSGQYGRGFYFTNSQSHAGTYGQQYSVYLNIRNPLEYGRDTVSRAQVQKFLESVAENEDYSIENYGTYDVGEILNKVMGKDTGIDAFQLIQDVNTTAIGDMVEAAELFNQVNGTEFDGIVVPTETVAFYPNQIKSATDNIGTFDGSNPDIRFSRELADEWEKTSTDTQGNNLTQEQQEFFAQSQARDDLGRLLLLYHQTAEDFTIFDTRRPGAGSRDGSTPFGIFLKRSARDIGLKGKKQMALYANIINPLRAANREDLARQLREISSRYAAIADNHKQLDAEYHEKFEQAKKAWRDYIVEWRAANPNANRGALNDDPKYNELFDAEDAVIEEWTAAADKLDVQAKEAITEDLRKAGYDGIFLENDAGSWGRQTDAIIALDPQQVKNVSNKKPTDNPDIRFSRERDDGDLPAYEQDSQEGLEELRKREEAEYADVKAKLASGELKPREELTTKAKNYLQKAERTLLNRIRYALSVPRVAVRENLKGTVEQLSAEFLATGRFTQETVDRLFEDAWNQGVIEDREFYDNYKHVKDFLRTSAVTISETDSHDIADYRDFKRRAWGTLKIVNEGGQSVDSVYSELMDMAPGLFPADITHPADQLERMYDVGKSIHIVEQNLNSIGGEFGRQMKQDARNAFEDAMQAVREDLRNVKRAADDLAERKRSEQEKPVYDSVEKVIEAYENMKKARRAAEKAVAQNLLTARDEMLVGRLLRGEILVEDLNPETDNVKGITEVYEAKKTYEELAKPLVEYKKKMKAHLLQMADTFLETANSWKDKKAPLAYSRETMRRNILDIVPDKTVAKQILEHYFEPIAKQEAQRTRFKTEMRQRVAALNLGTKVAKGNIVSESHAVQLLGEAQDNIQCLENAKGYMKTRDGKTLDEWHAVIRELWEQNPNLDRAKVQSAVDAFREIYDELFKQMNEVRVRFGYEPVNYRRGYFPHFQQQADGIMAQFGRALGIDTTVAALPTSITGITHTFKPGIRWFGNTLERLGFDTTYDAVGGFDMYIEGVSDVIFQTENIQNLRALASQIRYRTTDDGIREQIDKIKVDERLTEAEKDTKIREVYEGGKFVLNNFIKELDEYTNLLANKKSKWDRTAEDALGRTAIYRVYKQLNNMVAANMVVGNLTSPLTNLIPINQAMGRTGAWNMLRGMWDSFRNNVNLEKDGLDDISDFLTNRRGSELLSKTTMQKAQAFGGAFMEAVDMFTSGAVVRAEYYHNLQKGMTEAEAMHQADLFAADVIADRSKGAMPTIFASQVLKPVTAFQLEVNNEMSVIFKDLGRYYDDDEKGKLILAILAYFVGAYIFNDVFELVAGRRAAMDPLYILNELAGDTTGYQIPSLYEIISGNASFKTEREKDAGAIVKNVASNVASEMPFSALAAEVLDSAGILEVEEGTGRIPVSSAMPDVIKMFSAISDEDAASEYKWSVVADELSNLMYVIPPFGGAQLLKTGKGVYALIRGGSYKVNKKGEEELQYPIYTDTVGQAIWNGFKAVVLGKNSTGGALERVGSGFNSFNAKQTEVYQQLVASGVKQRAAFELVDELRRIRKTDEASQKDLQRQVLANSSVSDDGKLLAYNGFIASDSEQDLIVALTNVEEDSGAILKVLYGMKDAADLKGEEATRAKLEALDTSGMNAEGMLTAYYDLIAGDSEKEIIVELDAMGADSGSVYEAVRNIREAKLLKGDAETTAKWQAVAEADLTDGQKNVLAGYLMGSTELETEKGNPTQYAKLLEARKKGLSWEQYARLKVDGISVDKYLEYTMAGLDGNKAYELLVEIDGLEPMKGKDQIVDVQKWLEVAERPWNETMKDMALEGMMSESAYEKYREVADAGVRTYTYVMFLYDTYGWESSKDNGKVTKSLQDKIIEYIAGLNLTAAQKDALYLSKYSEKNLSKTPWHK